LSTHLCGLHAFSWRHLQLLSLSIPESSQGGRIWGRLPLLYRHLHPVPGRQLAPYSSGQPAARRNRARRLARSRRSKERRVSSDKSDKSKVDQLTITDVMPTRWSEGTIISNDLRQHYYRTSAGGEKPSLLLLHGFSENGLCWSRVARALEDDYDLILLDARGHGRSDLPATGYSQETLTADV